jgi:hypothetical protein
MTLRIPKNPTPYVDCYNVDDDCIVFPANATIMASDTKVVENPSEIVEVSIPSNVEFIQGGAFEDFVNLKKVEIAGGIYGVSEFLTPNGGVELLVHYEDPAELAKSLKKGNPIKIKREFDWK